MKKAILLAPQRMPHSYFKLMRAALVLVFVLLLQVRLSAAAGVFRWAMRAGGSGDDMGRSVAVDANGNVFIGGHFAGAADFGGRTLRTANAHAGFVAKFDTSGRFQWAQQFGGHEDDECRSIALDPSGNCIVTGNYRETTIFGTAPNQVSLTSDGGTEILVAKYDSSSDLLWARRAGGIGNDFGHAVGVDQRGNIYLTGSFEFQGKFESITLPGRDATQFLSQSITPPGVCSGSKILAAANLRQGLGLQWMPRATVV